MTPFLTEKLLSLAARRAARREVAEYAQRATANLPALDELIRRVLPLAQREAEEYAVTLQEPMPQHMRDALDLEIHQWERLRESIGDFRAAEPTARDIVEYTQHVRQYLSHQIDLLRIEEEMLGTCAVTHYRDAIRALCDAADAVPL